MAFGYVRVPPQLPAESSADRVRALEAAAIRCGWVLGETFIEDEPTHPLLAYRHLKAATVTAIGDHSGPVAILIVSPVEFADTADQARDLRTLIERSTGVPVVVTSMLQGEAASLSPDRLLEQRVESAGPGWSELMDGTAHANSDAAVRRAW